MFLSLKGEKIVRGQTTTLFSHSAEIK